MRIMKQHFLNYYISAPVRFLMQSIVDIRTCRGNS